MRLIRIVLCSFSCLAHWPLTDKWRRILDKIPRRYLRFCSGQLDWLVTPKVAPPWRYNEIIRCMHGDSRNLRKRQWEWV